jgi:hypothetical protein
MKLLNRKPKNIKPYASNPYLDIVYYRHPNRHIFYAHDIIGDRWFRFDRHETKDMIA